MTPTFYRKFTIQFSPIGAFNVAFLVYFTLAGETLSGTNSGSVQFVLLL